jgi:acyl carrier protein
LERGGDPTRLTVEVGERPRANVAFLTTLPGQRRAIALLHGATAKDLDEHRRDATEGASRNSSAGYCARAMVATTEARLRGFVVERLGFEGDPGELTGRRASELPDLLDSEEILEMVTWIEAEFEIEIADEEISLDNFLTLAHAARFVERKISEAGAIAAAPDRAHEG